MDFYELPTVERVHTTNGSHIEPDLTAPAGSLDALLWQVAVVSHDTGIPITARPGKVKVKRFGRWVDDKTPTISLQVGWRSLSAMSYGAAWTFLTGVSVGAEVKADA